MGSEMCIRDRPAVVGAVGGSLGLFLGFSCYGVLSDIIDNWKQFGIFLK